MKQVYLGPRLRGDDDEVTFRGDDETVTPRRIFMLGGRRTRAMTRWADEGPRLPLLTPT